MLLLEQYNQDCPCNSNPEWHMTFGQEFWFQCFSTCKISSLLCKYIQTKSLNTCSSSTLQTLKDKINIIHVWKYSTGVKCAIKEIFCRASYNWVFVFAARQLEGSWFIIQLPWWLYTTTQVLLITWSIINWLSQASYPLKLSRDCIPWRLCIIVTCSRVSCYPLIWYNTLIFIVNLV